MSSSNKDSLNREFNIPRNNDELLQILARMQGEIEARDATIASLECEQTYLLYNDIKSNRYFLDQGFIIEQDDPIYALQRDTYGTIDTNENKLTDSLQRPLKSDIANGLKYLELKTLIDSQKKMNELNEMHVKQVEEKYLKAMQDLKEEQRKHYKFPVHNNDTITMLEKERDHLQTELDHERSQNLKLQNDLKIIANSLAEEKALTRKQRITAAHLIKDRRRLIKELSLKCQQISLLENHHPLSVSVNSSVEQSSTFEDEVKLRALRTASVKLEISTSDLPGNRTSSSPGTHTTPATNLLHLTDISSSPCVTKIDLQDLSGLKDENISGSNTTPVKLKPEPPIRRTPESTSPTCSCNTRFGITSSLVNSQLSSITTPSQIYRGSTASTRSTGLADQTSNLAKEITNHLSRFPNKLTSKDMLESLGVETDFEARSSTPSPPPPPSPMQLHYPYPGMQGNTHHPPVQSISAPHIRQVATSHHFPGSPNKNRTSISSPSVQLPFNTPTMLNNLTNSRNSNSRHSANSMSNRKLINSKVPGFVDSSLTTQSFSTQKSLTVPVDFSHPSGLKQEFVKIMPSAVTRPTPPLSLPNRKLIMNEINHPFNERIPRQTTTLRLPTPRVASSGQSNSLLSSGHLYVNGK